MRHLTLMFSIFVFPLLEQFPFLLSRYELGRSCDAMPTAEPPELEAEI